MRTKIIKTEKEYDQAVKRIYKLMHQSEDALDPNSPEGEEAELLSILIEKYEQEHHKLGAPDPIEAIRFRMEQMDLKQVDVAPIFGGKTRVSEVFHGKRALSLKMIILLNRYLGIPLESLVDGNREIQLEPEKRKKLLNNSSIYTFVKSYRSAFL